MNDYKKSYVTVAKIAETEIYLHDKTKLGRKLESYNKSLTDDIKQGIENKDFNFLFNIEIALNEGNDTIYGEIDSRAGDRISLNSLKILLENARDTENVKNEVLKNEKEKQDVSPLKNNIFSKQIKKFQAYLSMKLLETRGKEAKELLRTRRDAFECIKVEYDNCLRKAMGKEPKEFVPRHVKQQKELER